MKLLFNCLLVLGFVVGVIYLKNRSLTLQDAPVSATSPVAPASPASPESSKMSVFSAAASSATTSIAKSLSALWSPSAPPKVNNNWAKSLLIVDGDEGMGSASIINWKGNALIVTNIHVLSGNENPRFRLLNGKTLQPDTLGLPEDRDILVASQHEISDGLEASTSVDSDVTIGDDVIVMGNSLGSDVVTEIPGKVLGIGPDLIETDAKFVHGNSGSPIIHLKTGKVIAIATFATVRKLDALAQDSQFTQVRRFGYRFDTVAKWQFVSPQGFAQESGLMAEIRQRSNELFYLAREIIKTQHITPLAYDKKGWVGGVVSEISSVGSRMGVGEIKYQRAFAQFQGNINSDIATARNTKLIPFHQRELKKEIEARTVLVDFFGRVNWDNVQFGG